MGEQIVRDKDGKDGEGMDGAVVKLGLRRSEF